MWDQGTTLEGRPNRGMLPPSQEENQLVALASVPSSSGCFDAVSPSVYRACSLYLQLVLVSTLLLSLINPQSLIKATFRYRAIKEYIDIFYIRPTAIVFAMSSNLLG